MHFEAGSFPGELPEVGGLPPSGAWTSGLQQLGIMCSIAFCSQVTLRHMSALQHLCLYCRPDDYSESDEAWEGLLDAAAAN